MYKIFMTSDNEEEFCMSNVKEYVVDENYIFIKNCIVTDFWTNHFLMRVQQN
mgnify:CR=1 FL=1